MFSVENLYYVLYINLFKKYNLGINFFKVFGSTDFKDYTTGFITAEHGNRSEHNVIMHDQEPVKQETLDKFEQHVFLQTRFKRFKIFCTSEHSDLVKNFCKNNHYYHLYFFFHGFAALDWFSDAQYTKSVDYRFQYPYISLNHLCNRDRSYRLQLVSNLIKNKLLDQGLVSLHHINNNFNLAKAEIFDPQSQLSKSAKLDIAKYLLPIKNSLTLDGSVQGNYSAHFGIEELKLWQSGLFHVVTETNFYAEKLHLTEKIFKPVVARRPFILLSSPGNLAYLKSYGFKTFDQWIDERYDQEQNPDRRIEMVVEQIERICSWDVTTQHAVKKEMQEILDFNFNHFYNDFKKLVVNELVENFASCMNQWNHGRMDDKIYDIDYKDLEEVKQTLSK